MKRFTTICAVAMKKSLMITLAGLLLTAAGTANADFTTINKTWDIWGAGPEQNLYDIDIGHTSILKTLYGNQVMQIDDFGAIITDQVWLNLNGGANVEVKYAAYTQNLGYIADTSGGSFTSLIADISANGYLSGLSTTLPPASSGLEYFRWADQTSGAPLWTSKIADNSDALDHMVTFLITGGPSAGNYAIAFDDQLGGGDRDFQDLVIEVDGVSPVPVPGAFLLGSIGLAFTSWKLRRRKEL